jgi:hypothetical protein
MLEEDDLSEFESTLKSLRPMRGGATPVAAAFMAGQRTRERLVRRWQGVAALALVVGLAVHLPRPEKGRSPELPQPVARSAELIAPALSEQSVQFLQQTIHERGVDALPRVELPSLRALGVDEVL